MRDDYTPEKHRLIVLAAGIGLHEENVAGYARVSIGGLHDWIRRGGAGEEPYATLVRDMGAASDATRRRLIDNLRDLAENGKSKKVRDECRTYLDTLKETP